MKIRMHNEVECDWNHVFLQRINEIDWKIKTGGERTKSEGEEGEGMMIIWLYGRIKWWCPKWTKMWMDGWNEASFELEIKRKQESKNKSMRATLSVCSVPKSRNGQEFKRRKIIPLLLNLISFIFEIYYFYFLWFYFF